MTKIISVSNQKGGVGKTTTAVNLAASFGARKKKTLLIDMDPQGNTTSGVGVDRRGVKNSTYKLLIEDMVAEEGIIKTEFLNLDIIPSTIDLSAAEFELINLKKREGILEEKINVLEGKYDYVIIDCPPSLGLITANAICASDSILIPVQCEYYALEGLSQLMNTYKMMKKLNKTLEIEGVLLTMYDSRLNLTEQVEKEIRGFFSDKVFKTIIHRGVRLSEAPSFGKPVYYYDRSSKGAKEYINLAKEIINKNKSRSGHKVINKLMSIIKKG